MRKLLILGFSMTMLFSAAAASLAAVTINGDLRYNMIDDQSLEGSEADASYGETDCRLRITGDLSDSAYVTANLQFKHTYDYKKKAGKDDAELEEFYATWKLGRATLKMGYYEYEFTPSQVELESNCYHVWPKNDATFEINVPFGPGLTVDGIFQPYAFEEVDEAKKQGDNSFGVALNYKAEKWGAKLTYTDFKDEYLTAVDLYWKLAKKMKLFAVAVDYSGNERTVTNNQLTTVYSEGFDPVIGFEWKEIANTEFSAAFEYAFNPRNDGLENEYTEYVIKAAYKFPNNLGLEYYHYIVGDDATKDMLRFRYEF